MNKGNILLIDDEPEIIEEFKKALVIEGYTVDTADSGEEGWEKYQNTYYDVLITDWKMGKMNGLALSDKIDRMHPSAKVIMITAYGDEDTAVKAHHCHAFDYLKKPVDMDDLLETVEEAVKRKDGVINALEDWVATHPEEAERAVEATLGGTQSWSAKDMLEEIKGNTERGRQEYQNLMQLTIDLLRRGRIK